MLFFFFFLEYTFKSFMRFCVTKICYSSVCCIVCSGWFEISKCDKNYLRSCEVLFNGGSRILCWARSIFFLQLKWMTDFHVLHLFFELAFKFHMIIYFFFEWWTTLNIVYFKEGCIMTKLSHRKGTVCFLKLLCLVFEFEKTKILNLYF